MDKLKGILSPGKHKDDETLYQTGPGDVEHSKKGLTGEGTHLKNNNQAQHNTGENVVPTGGQTATNTQGQSTSSQVPPTSVLNSSDKHKAYEDDKPFRQQMPGKYPSEATMSESHNPYTAHELDPRIGGSTVDDTPTQPAVRDDNAENQQSTSDTQLKGLNATRRENYGEDETRGNEPSSERFTSGDNSLFVAGGSAATAAALSQQYENEREGSAPLDRKADNAYTGTTPSGSNSNYYGAPSGTAVAGSQQPHPSDLAATKEYSSGVTQPVSSSEQQYTSGAGQAPYDDGRNASAIDRDNEQSHTLRNAAIGAGAAGVGGYAYREHQKDDLQSNSQTDRYTERRDYQTTQANQQREARSYNEQPTGQYSRKDDDHRTRNTAVGASVAPGAAAVGAHQYREHKSHAIQPEDQPAGYGTRSGNVGSSTESRYQTDLSYTTRGIEQTQAGNYPSNTERDDKDSHAVRNTAIGAGAAGVGAHKYREHKDRDRHDDLDTTRKSDMDSHKTTIDQEQPASGKHEVHHKSKLLNKLDPRVHSEKKTDDTHEGSSKSHRRKSNASADASAAALRRRSDASSEKKAAKSHSLDDAAHRPAQAGHPVELSPGVQLPKGNHYGKDVHDPRYGLGLNRAGITQEEAEALRRGEVDPASLHPLHGNNSGKLHKEKDEMGRSSTHSSTEKKRRSSLLGFLHRDKNKKYTKEEEDEFDRQERDHNARKALAGTTASHNDYNSGNRDKTLPPDPSSQRHGDSIPSGTPIYDQQTSLADRTRQPDTTTAGGYTGTAGQGDNFDRQQSYPTGNTGNTGNTMSSTYPGDGRDYPLSDTSMSTNRGDATSGLTGTQQPASYDAGYQQTPMTGTDDSHIRPSNPKVAERDGHNVLHKKGSVRDSGVGNKRNV